MKVALALESGTPLPSVRFQIQSIYAAVRTDHQPLLLPAEFGCLVSDARDRACDQLIGACDVILGFPSTLLPLLTARARCGSCVPCVVFALGALPRAPLFLQAIVPFLRAQDTLIVNSTSDDVLARKLFSNVHTDSLAFPYDGAFNPMTAQDRAEARKALGYGHEERILLYSGRMTLEKNTHSVLRSFAAVRRLLPQARLVLAGPLYDDAFEPFGVRPTAWVASLARLSSRLRLAPPTLTVEGAVDRSRLNELYNAADVLVNLTLHHDENFGQAQVEAMACGTPVVGTAWGGLRDSVVEEVSGHLVSVAVTPAGLKVSWWEALNRLHAILRDDHPEAMRRSCVARAREYSTEEFRRRLNRILANATSRGHLPEEALRETPLAKDLWRVRQSALGNGPLFRADAGTYALYEEIIRSYASMTGAGRCLPTRLSGTDVLTLAVPVARGRLRRYRFDDPMYPFEFSPPATLAQPISELLARFRAAPAARTADVCTTSKRREAVLWLLAIGALLRTRDRSDWSNPDCVPAILGQPVFRVRHLRRSTADVLVG